MRPILSRYQSVTRIMAQAEFLKRADSHAVFRMCDVTPVRQAGGAGRRKRNSRSPTTRSTHDSHMLFGLDFTSELKALLQEVTGARRR